MTSITTTTRTDANGDTITIWAVGRYGVQCECGSRGGYVETVTFAPCAPTVEWTCSACGAENVENVTDAQAREVSARQPWTADRRA